MSSELIEHYAQKIVDHIGPLVGFDPVTIFFILCSVIGLLMQCWAYQNSKVSPAELHAKLVDACSTPEGRDKIIKRAAKQFRRKSETKLSKADARILAEASIDEALATSPAELITFAAACGLLAETEQPYFESEAEDEQ